MGMIRCFSDSMWGFYRVVCIWSYLVIGNWFFFGYLGSIIMWVFGFFFFFKRDVLS